MPDEKSLDVEKMFDLVRELFLEKLSETDCDDEVEFSEESKNELINDSAEALKIYNEVLKTYNIALDVMNLVMSQYCLDIKDRKYKQDELAILLCIFNAYFDKTLKLTAKLKLHLHGAIMDDTDTQDFKQAV